MWYVITFMVGSCLGCLGMAILTCGARADDRTKIIRMRGVLVEIHNRMFGHWANLFGSQVTRGNFSDMKIKIKELLDDA